MGVLATCNFNRHISINLLRWRLRTYLIVCFCILLGLSFISIFSFLSSFVLFISFSDITPNGPMTLMFAIRKIFWHAFILNCRPSPYCKILLIKSHPDVGWSLLSKIHLNSYFGYTFPGLLKRCSIQIQCFANGG